MNDINHIFNLLGYYYKKDKYLREYWIFKRVLKNIEDISFNF